MRIMVAHPGHAFSTADCAWGYETALRNLGHVVDGFYYNSRLAFYDGAIRYWKKRNPAFKAGQAEKFILASETIAIEAIDFIPDVVLVINGFALHKRATNLLYALKIPTVLLMTESPYRDYEQAIIAKAGRFAGVLTNDKVSLKPLRDEIGLPVEYLPHSWNSERHFPQKVGPEYQSDVFFFGTLWPERERLLAKLKEHQNGHKFDLGGLELGKDPEPKIIENTELAMRYCGAKIAINHHRTIMGVDGEGNEMHVPEAWSLGPRAFEIAACGAFQLSDNTRPELKEVFGDSVGVYSDASDLNSKVEYYLAHEDERRDMASESYRRVQKCNFEDRSLEIVLPFLEYIVNSDKGV